MDLEMTGLDPDRHVILEVAVIVTDDELDIVAEAEPLILQATEDQLAEMDKVVQEMHAANGLLEEVRRSELTLAEAEQRTLKFLRHWCPNHGQVPLCGVCFFLLELLVSVELDNRRKKINKNART
jgi:oligoribonuclease